VIVRASLLNVLVPMTVSGVPAGNSIQIVCYQAAPTQLGFAASVNVPLTFTNGAVAYAGPSLSVILKAPTPMQSGYGIQCIYTFNNAGYNGQGNTPAGTVLGKRCAGGYRGHPTVSGAAGYGRGAAMLAFIAMGTLSRPAVADTAVPARLASPLPIKISHTNVHDAAAHRSAHQSQRARRLSHAGA
jgi:hypothetical protein